MGLDEVGTDSASGTVRVKVNPEFYRPLENDNLLGSAAKAKRLLGWEPQYSFKMLVEEMVLSDIQAVKASRIFSTSYLDWLVDESHTHTLVQNGEERKKAPGVVNGRAANGTKTLVSSNRGGVEEQNQQLYNPNE